MQVLLMQIMCRQLYGGGGSLKLIQEKRVMFKLLLRTRVCLAFGKLLVECRSLLFLLIAFKQSDQFFF